LAVAALVLGLATLEEPGAPSGFFFLVGIVALVWALILAVPKVDVAKVAAERRATSIQDLLEGNWDLEPSESIRSIVEEMAPFSGNADFGDARTPILIVEDTDDPFPGFGLLQAEVSLVCKPKDKDAEADLRSIDRRLRDILRERVEETEIPEVTFGSVIVAHGDTIPIDSWFLNKDKSPKLWATGEDLESIEARDPRVSKRVYFTVEILFPEFASSATFFIRPFRAGNAAAVHIGVATLGPPVKDWVYFKKRLLRHQAEAARDVGGEHQEFSGFIRGLRIEHEPDNLRWVRWLSRDRSSFKGNLTEAELNLVDIKSFEELSDFERKSFQEKLEKTIDENAFWPGSGIRGLTWRESHSKTFTADYFGRPEALATLKTLYEQIMLAALEGLDDQGFDTSDYQDDSGNYTINAEKIEQMIVGEKINVADKSGQEKTSDSSGRSSKSREKREEVT
ncbi:MAG: hypothetical protein AAGF23_26090, partial [Acidobacteriota bacterium]